MRRYKLIIFDWDGTLWNSGSSIIDVFLATARDLQVPEPKRIDVKNSIGLNLSTQRKLLFPDLDRQQFLRCFEKNYSARAQLIQLFPGTIEVLRELKDQGKILAIATSKYRKSLINVLHSFEMQDLFSAIRCGDDGCPKPEPEMLYEICQELDIAPDEAVMIGDSEHDMLMAKNANMARIAVTYGVQEREVMEACQPWACIDDVRDLSRILLAK